MDEVSNRENQENLRINPITGGVSEHPITGGVMQFCINQDISTITNARTLNRVASDTGMYWDVLHVLGKKLCTSKCTEKRLFFSSVLGNVLGFFFWYENFTRQVN